ncbi:hypothetical protein GCM10027035_23970 [Emticicia sediminis]
MSYWNNLKKSALLGTEKMPLQAELLPPIIKEKLDKTNKNDHEGYLLKAAAMVMIYEKAGQSPDNIILPEFAPAEEETQEFCSNEAVFALKTITQSDNFNVYLFDYFLDKCIEKNWVLPENQLVEVLNKTNTKALPKVHKILGARGKWLTQFNEAWQIQDKTVDQKTIWEEGKPSERKSLFARLRAESPSEALDLLKQSWEQESANDRKDFINQLATNISITDEDFLTEKYEELSTSKSNQKPITVEMLRSINLLRLMIHNSSCGQKVFQKISNYIEQKKGFLGLGNSTTLKFPKKEDDFWNGNDMHQLFGFDKLSSAKGISDAQYWFGELIRYIHPQYWLDLFDNDFKKTIAFFKDAESGKQKDKTSFLYQFSHAMQIASSAQIINFFDALPADSKDINWIDLVQKLPARAKEKVIIQNVSLDFHSLKELMKTSTEDWSDNFSHIVMKALVSEMERNNYYALSEKDFVNRLGRNLSLKIKNNIIDYGKSLSQDWQRNYWQTTFSESILKQLDLKEEINKI